MVAPVRVPSSALGEPVDLNLVGFAHRFQAGHAARLVVTTTDMAYRNNPVADVVTLSTGAGSTFSLPLPASAAPPAGAVPPAAAPGAAPAVPRADSTAAPSRRLPATGAETALPALGGVLLLTALGLASARRRTVSVLPGGRKG
jgi:LPXTG-motif cell wall-anchored protein